MMSWTFRPETLKILRLHSTCVYKKALSLAQASRYADAIDYKFLHEAVMLHDYGVVAVDAPELYCVSKAPYLMHGILGAEYLRGIDPVRYARHARVCERHIGVGLTAEEIIRGKLPLPARDFLPETFEEKLICYADAFFSKRPEQLCQEKSYEQVYASMARFGQGPLDRLEVLHKLWTS